ncbi:nitrate- and nitrite sensing domain-containing protein [Sulfurimonas sp. NWX367]|uniref:nitrate- and nitrite sensing domain-containing protein n=1 Tax=Sulfurimonas sp. NWX367 TaxID=2925413 RepID=UPI003204DAD6
MRLILLTLLLLLSLEAKSLFSNDTQTQTSKYVDNLKELIIATQKTRGLTNSYLNGNTAAMLLVYSSRDDMKQAIGNMESFSLAADPVINARATKISQALVKLNHKAFKQNPQKSFSDYTEQIEQTLMLAQSVNKRFAKDLTPFAKNTSSVMMEIMLPMTEYTGRLRGFGAGIAAKGKITKKEIENLQVLAYQLQSSNKKLQEEMTQILSNYSNILPSNINSELSLINRDVKEYTLLATQDLVSHPEHINADTYFNKGTEVISDIIKAYDTLNKAILEDSKGWF